MKKHRKFTDFELAAISAIPCVIGDFIASGTDIVWAFLDYGHNGYGYLLKVAASLGTTLPLFAVSLWIMWKAWKRHRDTSRKPVQHEDDIDYRIKLAILKYTRTESKKKRKH